MNILMVVFDVCLWGVAVLIFLFYGLLALHTRRAVRVLLVGQVVVTGELTPKQKENFLHSYRHGIKQFYFVKALMMFVLALIFLYFGFGYVFAACLGLMGLNFYHYHHFVV